MIIIHLFLVIVVIVVVSSPFFLYIFETRFFSISICAFNYMYGTIYI